MELPELTRDQLVHIVKHLSTENSQLRMSLLESNVRILYPEPGPGMGHTSGPEHGSTAEDNPEPTG